MFYFRLDNDTYTSLLTQFEFDAAEPHYDVKLFGDDPYLALIPAEVVQHERLALVLEKHTGSWCFLEPNELETYLALDGSRLGGLCNFFAEVDRPKLQEFLARLYWLGLLEVNGRRFFEPDVFKDRPTAEPTPLFLLTVTERCNLMCKYCHSSCLPSKRESMEWRTAEKIVDLIMEFPSDHLNVLFFGGEPLLEWDLVERIGHHLRGRADEGGKELTLILGSNGTLLTPAMARVMKDLEIHLGLSLDGDRATHDCTRVYPDDCGSYDAVTRAISLAKHNNMSFGAICTVSKANYRKLPQLLKHFSMLGLDSVRLNHIVRSGRAGDHWHELCLRPKEFLEAHMEYLDYVAREEYPIVDTNVRYMAQNIATKMHPTWCQRSPCGAGKCFFSFSPAGTVHPCSRWSQHNELELGNVLKLDSLVDLWQTNPVMVQLGERRSDELPLCKKCLYLRFCEAGCMLHSYSYAGSTKAPNPWCAYNKGMYRALFQKLAEAPHILQTLCPEATVYSASFSFRRLSAEQRTH